MFFRCALFMHSFHRVLGKHTHSVRHGSKVSWCTLCTTVVLALHKKYTSVHRTFCSRFFSSFQILGLRELAWRTTKCGVLTNMHTNALSTICTHSSPSLTLTHLHTPSLTHTHSHTSSFTHSHAHTSSLTHPHSLTLNTMTHPHTLTHLPSHAYHPIITLFLFATGLQTDYIRSLSAGPGCPRPSIASQAQYRGLNHHSFALCKVRVNCDILLA